MIEKALVLYMSNREFWINFSLTLIGHIIVFTIAYNLTKGLFND